MTEAWRVAWLAHEHNIQWVPHGWNTAVGLAADRHLAAATPVARYVEFLTPSPYIDELITEPFRPDAEGCLTVPEKPGLGIELEVDLDRGWTSLEQELQKLTPDSSSGLLRVDKLFEMDAKGSGDPRFAHFEAQMARDPELPWRMFKYGRRAGEHFHQPVGRFAILGDEDPRWSPGVYREGVLGCEDTFTFRVAKLWAWRERLAELEAGTNLFGLFLCAHLEIMATRGDVPRRQDAKFRILANLMRRDVLQADLQRWYRLIDWIMKLPAAANRAVWLRLEELKEPKSMSHVTFAESYGREKGIKDSLREALVAKFPREGPALAAEFQDEQDLERLKSLVRLAVLAESPDDFRSRASSPS